MQSIDSLEIIHMSVNIEQALISLKQDNHINTVIGERLLRKDARVNPAPYHCRICILLGKGRDFKGLLQHRASKNW